MTAEERLSQWVDDLQGECARIEEKSWVEDDPLDCLAAGEDRPCPHCGLRKAIADRVREVYADAARIAREAGPIAGEHVARAIERRAEEIAG